MTSASAENKEQKRPSVSMTEALPICTTSTWLGFIGQEPRGEDLKSSREVNIGTLADNGLQLLVYHVLVGEILILPNSS